MVFTDNDEKQYTLQPSNYYRDGLECLMIVLQANEPTCNCNNCKGQLCTTVQNILMFMVTDL